MKKYFLIFFIITVTSVNAQPDVTASMGLNFYSASSFSDYIDFYFAPVGNELQTFNSSVEFAGEVTWPYGENYAVGVEYGHQVYSYNASPGKSGYYDISFVHYKPSVVGYYVLPGEGYKFKFGAGIGYRYASFEEKISNSPETIEYSASGFGVLLKAEGHTLLSDDLYAYIGSTVRYDFTGDITGDNHDLTFSDTGEAVNLNMLGAVFSLGVSYFF